MVALVEAELEVDGLAVQRHVAVAVRRLPRADLAKAEIGRHDVVVQRQRDVVEVGVVQIPEAGLRERDLARDDLLADRDREREGLSVHVRAQRRRARRRRAERRLQADGREREGRDESHAVEECRAARLQVDGLPDAARVAVALLAVEVAAVPRGLVARIPDGEGERLRLAPAHEFRQLELEGRVAAHVLAEVVAVERADRVMVGRAHDDEDALPLPRGRHRHRAAVVAVVGLHVVYARERRAPAERHGDLPVQPVGREAEVPRAVQVDPLRAHPVRARMLGKRNLGRRRGQCPKRRQRADQSRQFHHVPVLVFVSFSHPREKVALASMEV